MNGDFSRTTFRPEMHYSGVLMQQGRVLLDSDWNEQVAIFNYHFQTLARDLIGPYGGPRLNAGFKVIKAGDPDIPTDLRGVGLTHNFWIGSGHYYVDGLLCENDSVKLYAPPDAGAGISQADWIPEEWDGNGPYLVYLDVWQRHVTALEDQAIREVALGPQGPDTTTRVKTVWQVKTIKLTDQIFNTLTCANTVANGSPVHEGWARLLRELQPENRGRLRAKADEPDDINVTSPCIISPDARFRGSENQLYRVEIHEGGSPGSATFKWSRDNGSIALQIRSVSGNKVTLEHMGRDERSGIQVGDWVEIEGANHASRERRSAPPLLRIEEVNYVDMFVLLSKAPETGDPGRVLRRWDQKPGDPLIGGLELRDGAALIKEATPERDNWLTLEDGVQVQFQQSTPANVYRSGDYWIIPARTATGDVDWPGPLNALTALGPHGTEHHFAPLARITVQNNNVTEVLADLRRMFGPLAECEGVDGGGGV